MPPSGMQALQGHQGLSESNKVHPAQYSRASPHPAIGSTDTMNLGYVQLQQLLLVADGKQQVMAGYSRL